jgi:hypothetical protein
MHGEAFFTPVRIVSYVVLAAMAGAIGYSAWISLAHWTGIGV